MPRSPCPCPKGVDAPSPARACDAPGARLRAEAQPQPGEAPELLRGSISHWREREQAIRASERRTCFVARLELPPASLTRVALTEEWGSGHVDVWAHPAELVAAVADVAREQRQGVD